MMSQSAMNLSCRWEIFLVSLWIQVGFVPLIHCNTGIVKPPSWEEVLLFKDEQSPKCFARTQRDFTCFFETADNSTYDFIYTVVSLTTEERCEMTVQQTVVGTHLHICSFPPRHVFTYVDIHLKVVDGDNHTLYQRTVSVDDHALLDPPFNVSLQQIDEVGQLQVSWKSEVNKYWKEDVMYKIRYSSMTPGVKNKETAKEKEILDLLVAGEEVEVQVAAKYCPNPNAGHWSSWSHPVRARVPQITHADNISLMCFTSDLQHVTCQWNSSRYGAENKYKLSYKTHISEARGWEKWTECLANMSLTDRCGFHGAGTTKFRVRVSGGPLGRTFYSPDIFLSKIIKTPPPCDLEVVEGAPQKGKLCLKWKASPSSPSTPLQYEVGYQIREGQQWMMVSLREDSTCLQIPSGHHYIVKIRAKPAGPIYSGYWSDWSDVLTGETPVNQEYVLMLVIPVAMLITAVVLISSLRSHLSKLKLYIWPPVPNLDKVLQGYLTEMNGQKWNFPVTPKQCTEETMSCVVKVISEEDLGKPFHESSQLLSPEGSFSSGDRGDASLETEVFPDYVTLNRDSVILCSKGNKYFCKQMGERDGLGLKDELFQVCHCSCTDLSVCLGSDFLNQSYLSLAEPVDRFDCMVTAAKGPGNLYTNFPCC